jgi:hypothetical protein
MPDGIDAAMNAVKPTCPQTAADGALVQPTGEQLPRCDQASLLRSDLSDLYVDVNLSHNESKSSNAWISPPGCAE